jgi:hypothetical protein
MFAVHCPRHASRVLLTPRNITRIEGRGPDLTVHWTCHCGHHGHTHPRRPETRESTVGPAPLKAAC